MTDKQLCPMCNLAYSKKAVICENCGVDLILAAIVEKTDINVDFQNIKIAVSPEIFVPRVGDYLVEKGAINKEQLEQALTYQKEHQKVSGSILLGEVLVKLDLINRKTLDHAITGQIYDLQIALKKSNSALEQRVEERTKELKNALEKLTELNQLKSNFISNISHELRTPLSHIIGYVDLLLEETLGPSTDKQKKAFNVISKSSDRLHSLIQNLVQFSLLSSGKIQLNKEPIQASKIIKNSILKNTGKANSNNINLKFRNCSEEILITADNEKISWVIDQLLDNAIKFNRNPGHVLLNTKITNDILTISVQDSGIGIEKENIDDIFEAFHQVDSGATRHAGGTGLGLNLVMQILDAHDCKINVISTIGEGSIFEFSLPIYKS